MAMIEQTVSMESGLEGRNNNCNVQIAAAEIYVSMESGLEGRNNGRDTEEDCQVVRDVSMESGLEGRNNLKGKSWSSPAIQTSQWSPA